MAAADFFLKIDGVDGESQDATHKGSIEIKGWSWGEHNQGTFSSISGGGAGKVNMGDFNFSQLFQCSSPELAVRCATGEHIKKAVLTCRKAGKEQREYLKITMEDVLVSDYHTGGTPEGGTTDSISLNFTKITWSYNKQKADGSMEGWKNKGYDLKAQKAS